MSASSPSWLPSDRWVRWLLIPCVAFLALASSQAYLLDFWHHLARGRAIVQTGQLLNNDIFTYTIDPQQRFQDVNWLSQIFYYFLFSLGGLDLVRVANALVIAGTFVWLMVLCKRRAGSLEAALVSLIFTFVGVWEMLTIRPQTFSMLLFVILYDVLDRARQHRAWLVVPPFILALWVNLHGAFPAGLILLGATTLAAWCDAIYRALSGTHAKPTFPASWKWAMAGCLLASLLATLLNPYGTGIYKYVGMTSNIASRRGIDEWLAPGFDGLAGIMYFLSIGVAVGLLAATWRRKPLALTEAFLLACFLVLASRSLRMSAWWLLTLVPILAERVALFMPRREEGRYEPNLGAALTVVVLLYLTATSLPGLHALNPLLRYRPPQAEFAHLEKASDFLMDHHEGGNLFGRYEWGEYLTWSAHPRFKVFMDGRIEIFPEPVWKDYVTVTFGRDGWQEILENYRVDALVLDAEFHGQRLYARVKDSPRWKQAFRSGDAMVFFRDK